MARLSYFMSWFCFSLAGVLLTVAMLAVPENAFADPGTDYCTGYCNGLGLSPGDYITCVADCKDGYYDCADCANYSGNEATWCNQGCAQGQNMCDKTNCVTTSCLDLPCVAAVGCKKITDPTNCGGCICMPNSSMTSCVCGK